MDPAPTVQFDPDRLRQHVAGILGQSSADAQPAIRALIRDLNAGLAAGAFNEVSTSLRNVITPTLSYTAAQGFYRIRERLRGKVELRHKIKVAVLGSFTTKQLISLMDLFLFAAGVELEVYEADFGVFRQEIMDSSSGLYAFHPHILILATTRRDIAHKPTPFATAGEVSDLAQRELSEWGALWQQAHQTLHCQIIQNNFDTPWWRALGNHETRQTGGLGRYLAQLNLSLAETAPSFVTIHDVDHLAASVGRMQWDDARFFHQAKLPCDPECLVPYGHSLASLITAQLGLAKKCLVLDLDNTLWGGVIGDDGLGGIRLGQGDAESEAFVDFQNYLQALKARGILLAVCSKNNHETAWEVFERHTEMILRPEDISCFVANWNDKATNLRTIAKELNIGLDSLVFVDDNPAERAIVRQVVPEVAVPELPVDPADYIRAIEQHRYFQVLSVGSEDFNRTEMYKADNKRREIQTSTADMGTFLSSLEMRARIVPVSAANLERSAQLIQRSNQFNLTTRRHSPADLGRLMEDPVWLTRTISLADRFGDNGLISVILACKEDSALVIDTWLMSCRVLKRGVETFVLNHLAEAAKKQGLQKLIGTYIPTSKNSLVKDHYANLGFKQTGTTTEGETRWELDLGAWQPAHCHIRDEAAA